MSFPETRHSAVLGLQEKDECVRRQSYEKIIQAYWKPVHQYLRLRWRETDENAADLTQAFFSRTIEAATLTSYDPGKGTFRTYLRTCLDRFVINAHKKSSRIQTLALDFEIPAPSQEPEAIFNHEWVRSLLIVALEDLSAGRDTIRFRVFERYDLSDAEGRPTYDELAKEFGLTTITVTNYLSAMRRDFRKALLNRLREVTATEREFRSEARAIFGVQV